MKMFSATRDVRAKRDLLVHEADAERLRHGRRGDRDRVAVEADLAAVRAQDAVDDVHQRRLAGAVFAGERMDLAPAQFEVDAAQRMNRPEGLGSGW